MIGSKILASLAAMVGLAATTTGMPDARVIARHIAPLPRWNRRATRGSVRPAASKLLRKAAKGRLGMATIR